jgi:hypothetical protein
MILFRKIQKEMMAAAIKQYGAVLAFIGNVGSEHTKNGVTGA